MNPMVWAGGLSLGSPHTHACGARQGGHRHAWCPCLTQECSAAKRKEAPAPSPLGPAPTAPYPHFNAIGRTSMMTDDNKRTPARFCQGGAEALIARFLFKRSPKSGHSVKTPFQQSPPGHYSVPRSWTSSCMGTEAPRALPKGPGLRVQPDISLGL